MSANKQYYFIDALRSFLMLSVVVLHSSRVFDHRQHWLLYSDNPSWFAEDADRLVHVYAMQAFFLISGMLCVPSLRRHTPSAFVRHRLLRLGVPFLLVALIFNPVQAAILHMTGWQAFEFAPYINTGEWLSHLWFLANLTLYFLVTYLVIAYFPRTFWGFLGLATDLISKARIEIVLLVVPIFAVAIHGLEWLGLPITQTVLGFDTYQVAYYSIFFVFGMVLASSGQAMSQFRAISPIVSIGIIALCAVALRLAAFEGKIGTIAHIYLDNLQHWFAISLLFYLFSLLFSEKSKFFSFMSAASYTMYLTHYVLVIGLGALFIEIGIGGTFGFALLVSSIVFITVALHRFVICRNGALSVLFGAKDGFQPVPRAA